MARYDYIVVPKWVLFLLFLKPGYDEYIVYWNHNHFYPIRVSLRVQPRANAAHSPEAIREPGDKISKTGNSPRASMRCGSAWGLTVHVEPNVRNSHVSRWAKITSWPFLGRDFFFLEDPSDRGRCTQWDGQMVVLESQEDLRVPLKGFFHYN